MSNTQLPRQSWHHTLYPLASILVCSHSRALVPPGPSFGPRSMAPLRGRRLPTILRSGRGQTFRLLYRAVPNDDYSSGRRLPTTRHFGRRRILKFQLLHRAALKDGYYPGRRLPTISSRIRDVGGFQLSHRAMLKYGFNAVLVIFL